MIIIVENYKDEISTPFAAQRAAEFCAQLAVQDADFADDNAEWLRPKGALPAHQLVELPHTSPSVDSSSSVPSSSFVQAEAGETSEDPS